MRAVRLFFAAGQVDPDVDAAQHHDEIDHGADGQGQIPAVFNPEHTSSRLARIAEAAIFLNG